MRGFRKTRSTRARIDFPVDVRGSRQSFTAVASDLSIGGLCLRSPIRLNAGERAGITLRFPGGFVTAISAEVRWSAAAGLQDSLIGMEFIHSPESRKLMQRLVYDIESGLPIGGAAPRRPGDRP